MPSCRRFSACRRQAYLLACAATASEFESSDRRTAKSGDRGARAGRSCARGGGFAGVAGRSWYTASGINPCADNPHSREDSRPNTERSGWTRSLGVGVEKLLLGIGQRGHHRRGRLPVQLGNDQPPKTPSRPAQSTVRRTAHCTFRASATHAESASGSASSGGLCRRSAAAS